MPKLKTRRSLMKRYKITSQNKIMRRRSGKSHLLAKKNSNKKRTLSLASQVSKADSKAILFYTNIN
uniref:ribosomal protein L35 n=1 Tax=Glaucosphaera vacuolata TaxID=38265 RepID=UPI001FCCFCB2|nr:ribosomal protein L35 [Glaucosphaera vacuolata]UNJ18594.1 ribosomal protein L35 [Glaucosphaera vacuolata]